MLSDFCFGLTQADLVPFAPIVLNKKHLKTFFCHKEISKMIIGQSTIAALNLKFQQEQLQEKQFQQLLPNISNRVFINFFLMPYNKFFGLGIKKEVVLRKREREQERKKRERERES